MNGSQQPVIDFLSDPASHGLPGAALERIETHCSIVFLVADRACKLKRAICFASLDYTTVERRRAACEAELRLNTRAAPELYQAVRAITASAGGLEFDGAGPALDHVVVMRRFDQADLFEHMAEAGRLTPQLMRDLGETIARFHAAAPVTWDFGGADGIRRMLADNDRELAFAGAALDGASFATLSRRAHDTLDRVADLLDTRQSDGHVRRCHGDLRLANICLYGNRPTLFDCIEFADDIGCIDVLYDLAFLLMDLHLRGRDDLGNIVFNAWLDRTRETDGLRALPLFLSARAATRSYALAAASHRRGDPEEARALLARARRHVEAAMDFLDARPPVLVMLGGSDDRARVETAARLAARVPPAPGARVLRAGAAGEAVWREALAVLLAGVPVLLEGRFGDSDERNATVALPPGIRLLPFWLGDPPPGLDPRIWQAAEAGPDGLAAMADAAADAARCGASSAGCGHAAQPGPEAIR